MNMSRSRTVESPEGYFCRKQREYNFVYTHIKIMTNFVNPHTIVKDKETEGDPTRMLEMNIFAESPYGFEAW